MVSFSSGGQHLLSVRDGILSRFNAVSNSTSPRPKPIRCRDSKSGEHHHALSPSHSRKQQTREGESYHCKRCSARQSKCCPSGPFPPQCRQCRRDGSIHKQACHRRECRIPSKIAGARKYQQQQRECQNGNVWRSKSRMNRREKSREISTLSHRKRHSR